MLAKVVKQWTVISNVPLTQKINENIQPLHMIYYSPTGSRALAWLGELWEMEQKLNLYIYKITLAQ